MLKSVKTGSKVLYLWSKAVKCSVLLFCQLQMSRVGKQTAAPGSSFLTISGSKYLKEAHFKANTIFAGPG